MFYETDVHEARNYLDYISVEKLPDFLQQIGLPITKPTLIRQQIFGVLMRTLPETELFEYGRDTRKRFYHPLAVFESIAASRLFSGDYWTNEIHAARLVQMDIFIGRLGYYAQNFDELNEKYHIVKQRGTDGFKRKVTFRFSLNEAFRKLLLQTGDVLVEEKLDSKTKYEIIDLNKAFQYNNITDINAEYINYPTLSLVNNEAEMDRDTITNMFSLWENVVSNQLFNKNEANYYTKYQTLMYARTIANVIQQYEKELSEYIRYNK